MLLFFFIVTSGRHLLKSCAVTNIQMPRQRMGFDGSFSLFQRYSSIQKSSPAAFVRIVTISSIPTITLVSRSTGRILDIHIMSRSPDVCSSAQTTVLFEGHFIQTIFGNHVTQFKYSVIFMSFALLPICLYAECPALAGRTLPSHMLNLCLAAPQAQHC
jgi:hypothetical protein